MGNFPWDLIMLIRAVELGELESRLIKISI